MGAQPAGSAIKHKTRKNRFSISAHATTNCPAEADHETLQSVNVLLCVHLSPQHALQPLLDAMTGQPIEHNGLLQVADLAIKKVGEFRGQDTLHYCY